MDFTTVIRTIRKSWIIVLALVLLGGAAGAGVSFIQTPVYSSETRMFVAFQSLPSSTPADLVQANNFAVQKVVSYVQVVNSPRVLDTVIKNLNLTTTSEDLAKDVHVSVSANSVVISITADASNPQDAATLSSTVASVFGDIVVNELESPVGGGPGPVKVEVLQPAIAPESPSSPNTLLNIALGIFAGLVIGLLFGLAMAVFDRRVHNRAQAAAALTAPMLASIPRTTRFSGGTIALRDEPHGNVAEAYRLVRTNLLLGRQNTGAKSFTLTSAITGEGTTTTAINLALSLAEAGRRVALIDGDLRNGTLSRALGLEKNVGLSEYLSGVSLLPDMLTQVGSDALTVFAAGRSPENSSDLLGGVAMAELIADLHREMDFVIIDAPPLLNSSDATLLCATTDRTVLVVAAGLVRTSEVKAASATLDSIGVVQGGVVMTMVPAKGPDSDPLSHVPARADSALPARQSA